MRGRMVRSAEAVLNSFASTLRGWRGTQSFKPAVKRPEALLKLYDIEASPQCRLVREVLTELDLDAFIYPCPIGGIRFRPIAQQMAGKAQFPLLVDENRGIVLDESAGIIEYLLTTYGERAAQGGTWRHPFEVGTSYLSSAFLWRPSGIRGLKAHPSKMPEQPLELYSFESSPYAKRVRVRLCELEIPYILRSTGKGAWTDMGPPSFRDHIFKGLKATTPHRKWLAERTGAVQVPYLVDPNTNTEMYESDAILDYLRRTYETR